MATEELITPENDTRDFVGYDLMGFPFNKKYPPNPAVNGNKHHGYATDNQEAFLYDVAVYLYGIKFTFNGHRYWIPSDGEGWVLIDLSADTHSASYDNPIELMENATIDGKRIIDIIDDVKDIVMQ